jgi:hypothetical protein
MPTIILGGNMENLIVSTNDSVLFECTCGCQIIRIFDLEDGRLDVSFYNTYRIPKKLYKELFNQVTLSYQDVKEFIDVIKNIDSYEESDDNPIFKKEIGNKKFLNFFKFEFDDFDFSISNKKKILTGVILSREQIDKLAVELENLLNRPK